MNETLVRVALACVACDGKFDDRELQVLKRFAAERKLCDDETLNRLVSEFKSELARRGLSALRDVIDGIRTFAFNREESASVLNVAYSIIVADETIDYLEVKFFKVLCQVLCFSPDLLSETVPGIDPVFCRKDLDTLSPLEDYFQAAESWKLIAD